jgi:hypothetical protein
LEPLCLRTRDSGEVLIPNAKITREMPRDELDNEQRKQAKQYVFWTAIAVLIGYIVLFVF